jgi:gluconolactonase
MTLLSRIEPVVAVLKRPHGLLEAPRFGASGELLFSDALGGGLWTCSADGELSELLPRRRGIGGAVAHADGGWVISGRTLLHLRPDGTQRELLGGDGVCGFNDLGATHDGELLAGVLRYRPLAGEPERDGQLIRIDTRGTVTVLSERVTWPNGIGVAPDGNTIYLSDYARACVLAVSPDGQEVRELCRSPGGSADGLAVDAEGGVWVALGQGGAIGRFLPDGRLDELVTVPAQFVSSLCFGGPDLRDVLITTAGNHVNPELGGALFRARCQIGGLALSPVVVGA